MTLALPLLATIFIDPMTIGPGGRLAMLMPLSLSIALVYKTIRLDRMADLPRAAAQLWVTIILGMLAVGAGLYLAFVVLR